MVQAIESDQGLLGHVSLAKPGGDECLRKPGLGPHDRAIVIGTGDVTARVLMPFVEWVQMHSEFVVVARDTMAGLHCSLPSGCTVRTQFRKVFGDHLN